MHASTSSTGETSRRRTRAARSVVEVYATSLVSVTMQSSSDLAGTAGAAAGSAGCELGSPSCRMVQCQPILGLGRWPKKGEGITIWQLFRNQLALPTPLNR